MPDETDACPNSDPTAPVDEVGCNFIQRDDDGDGVLNVTDTCPYSDPFDTPIDANGCDATQQDLDADGDGINDNINPSINFGGQISDQSLDGGTTFGEILERGDQILTVVEEPNPDGSGSQSLPRVGRNWPSSRSVVASAAGSWVQAPLW